MRLRFFPSVAMTLAVLFGGLVGCSHDHHDRRGHRDDSRNDSYLEGYRDGVRDDDGPHGRH
jgi:hypothetical protein